MIKMVFLISLTNETLRTAAKSEADLDNYYAIKNWGGGTKRR